MSVVSSIKQYLQQRITKHILVIEAIEVRNAEEQSFVFNALLLQKDKSKVTIEKKGTGINAEELQAWVKLVKPAQCAVILNINSDRIIHKMTGEGDEVTLVKEILPNVDPNTFYCQFFPIAEGKNFLSIIKRSLVDHLLTELFFIKDIITNVSAGPFFILQVYKHFFVKDGDDMYNLDFANYSFRLVHDDVVDYKINSYAPDTEKREFRLDDETITAALLIPYAYGIHYLLDPGSAVQLPIVSVQNNYDEQNFRQLGKIVFLGASLLVLLLLICSSVLFSQYNTKYQDLQSTISYKQALWEQYQVVAHEEQKKLDFLQENGLATSSNIAYYADQLTAELPGDIYLRKMDIQPVNTRSASENIDFMSHVIIVEGNCNSSIELNEWIHSIRAYAWVKQIVIKSFKQNRENIGSFIIEITK